MASAGAPGSGLLGDVHGPIKKDALDASGLGAPLDEARVDFFEEARDRSRNSGADFEESLGDGVDRLDVGKGGALKEIDVVASAAIDVGERKERKRNVLGGIETEVVADVGDIGAKVGVREHDALGLAGGAGGVDERSELAGKNLGSAQAVRGDIRRARADDESFVAETFAGDALAAVGDDNLLEFGKAGADGE